MTFATVGSSTGLAGDRDRRWTPESGLPGRGWVFLGLYGQPSPDRNGNWLARHPQVIGRS